MIEGMARLRDSGLLKSALSRTSAAGAGSIDAKHTHLAPCKISPPRSTFRVGENSFKHETSRPSPGEPISSCCMPRPMTL